jgi:hypothetical protein
VKHQIPGLRLASKLNQRLHWSKRARDSRNERQLAYLVTAWHAAPCVVTITRIGPRRLDDDNLAGACKSVRDGIADRLGVDDGGDLVQWRYAQRSEGARYAVEIEIEQSVMGEVG